MIYKKTYAHTFEQNEIVENRVNRVESGLTLLVQFGVPKSYWLYIFRNVALVLNGIPCKVLSFNLLYFIL